MPSLPSKTSRQKHVTPIANLHENDVWQRTFKLLGLQPLTPFPDSGSGSIDMAEDATAVDTPVPSDVTERAGPVKVSKEKTTFTNLPHDIQCEIFKHASSTDLIALCLVSKKCRDLAAKQLYRNFHIVFPDEDDPSYESPIDGLAGGLDTLVTSEYNYSQYLKEIVLDTLSGGGKGERAYRHYTYDLSCGKFMNTLFLLALRKAQALETFKWDLRVEISRPVFKALHNIRALQSLHIRMHAGTSLYEVPPPLPSLAQPSSTWQIVPTSSPHSPSLGPPPPPFSSGSNSYSSVKFAIKPKLKSSDVVVVKQPPTLSGFSNLKSLSILDMDTLDFVEELRLCIKKSSSTLRKVKLSFSENLARQARKPTPVEDPNDESDQEMDEFGQINPPPPPPPNPAVSDDFTGPAKTFRAQEEEKKQGAVLGRVFGVEPSAVKKADGDTDTSSDAGEEKPADKATPGEKFLKDLLSLGKRLTNDVNGAAPRTQQQKEVLDLIEKAGRMYVAEIEEKKAKAAKVDKKLIDETASEGSSTAKATPESSAASTTDKAEEEDNADSKSKEPEPPSKTFDMFGEEIKRSRKSKEKDNSMDESNPDDINIDEPEVVTDLKDFEEVSETREMIVQNGTDAIAPAKEAVKTLSGSENTTSVEKNADIQSTKNNEPSTIEQPKTGVVSQAPTEQANKDDLKVEVKATGSPKAENSEEMNEYLRSSHGLPLHTLSIYLVPIKASVLSKAIDLYALNRITLLNVGTQAPFWHLLSKQNKQSPLPLCKIHTDHVSLQFLTCVSQLDTVKQLFLLERNSKVPEYSMITKTTVVMDQIRRIALKKHIGTLEKLMVKNENDPSWDANEQVLKLICKRGKNLEELAVSFGVRAVHTFNQYLPGLTKLRALHIINFRNDDTCHWVVREVRKFAVDCVSHNPDMKLEYIGMENTVERLVRRIKLPKSKDKGKGKAEDKGKGKGKGKEVTSFDPAVQALTDTLPNPQFPTLESIFAPPVEEESSDDSGSEDGLSPGLKLETLEGVRFYDVYGVRIFRKDVMAGRL